MDIDAVVEMLKNNRALWVAATVTGCFAVIASILNAIWSFFQRKKQLNYDQRLENHKSELAKEMEELRCGLGMELESFKSGLEKKKYVSKVRFDTEFSLFKNLWGSCRKMVNDVYFVYPTYASVPTNKEAQKEYEQRVYEDAKNSYKVFCELLGNNAPFISVEIYAKFDEIRRLCGENISIYEERWNRGNLFIWEGSQDKKDAEREAYKRTREFDMKYKSLIDELRFYLDRLDAGKQDESTYEKNYNG